MTMGAQRVNRSRWDSDAQAAREEPTEDVRVSMTYGPIEAHCEEHVDHLRHFWSELGRIIEQIDADREAPSAGGTQ